MLTDLMTLFEGKFIAIKVPVQNFKRKTQFLSEELFSVNFFAKK